jgi:hypothetical protein
VNKSPDFREITLEQYYTTEKDAKRLYAEVSSRYGHIDFDNYIEPSCGSGVWLELFPASKRIGLDLEPHHPEAIKQDFFEFTFPKGRNIAIGNPPFGRKGKIAMQFLNRCAEHSDVVAMILPSIFSKFTFINRVNPVLHLVYETPVREFVTPDGEPYSVKCVFQIWENKYPQLRPKIIRQSSCPQFDMIHRHISRTTPEELEQLKQEYDFTIAQIEGKVGDTNVTKGSQFFVKDNTPDKCVRKIMEQLSYTDNKDFHIGAVSLTRADVVERFLVKYNKR